MLQPLEYAFQYVEFQPIYEHPVPLIEVLNTKKERNTAQVEGKDWKEAVQTYLVAYRNTPHPSTGVCPSELLFGRTLCTKLPDLRQAAKLDEEVKDRDQEKKIKMKEYSDRMRKAEESNLVAGG